MFGHEFQTVVDIKWAIRLLNKPKNYKSWVGVRVNENFFILSHYLVM